MCCANAFANRVRCDWAWYRTHKPRLTFSLIQRASEVDPDKTRWWKEIVHLSRSHKFQYLHNTWPGWLKLKSCLPHKIVKEEREDLCVWSLNCHKTGDHRQTDAHFQHPNHSRYIDSHRRSRPIRYFCFKQDQQVTPNCTELPWTLTFVKQIDQRQDFTPNSFSLYPSSYLPMRFA